jgi:hypothetical protein
MIHRHWKSISVLLIGLVFANVWIRSSSTTPDHPTGSRQPAPPEPPIVHHRSLLGKTLPREMIEFSDTRLEESFDRTLQLIQKLQVSWDAGSNGDFEWRSRDYLVATWRSAGRTVTLTVGGGEPVSTYFELQCTWASPTGGNSWFRYRLFDRNSRLAENIVIAFDHERAESPLREPLLLSWGDSSYRATYSDSRWNYWVDITESSFPPTSVPGEISAYWESGESFRHLARSEVLRLQEAGVPRILTGDAFQIDHNRPRSGGDPPMLRPIPDNEAIPESILQQALQDFDLTVARRLQWIDDHHRELHDQLVSSFPEFHQIVLPLKPLTTLE